jgi:hypothetical protein
MRVPNSVVTAINYPRPDKHSTLAITAVKPNRRLASAGASYNSRTSEPVPRASVPGTGGGGGGDTPSQLIRPIKARPLMPINIFDPRSREGSYYPGPGGRGRRCVGGRAALRILPQLELSTGEL